MRGTVGLTSDPVHYGCIRFSIGRSHFNFVIQSQIRFLRLRAKEKHSCKCLILWKLLQRAIQPLSRNLQNRQCFQPFSRHRRGCLETQVVDAVNRPQLIQLKSVRLNLCKNHSSTTDAAQTWPAPRATFIAARFDVMKTNRIGLRLAGPFCRFVPPLHAPKKKARVIADDASRDWLRLESELAAQL
jgi:hypothetical protein